MSKRRLTFGEPVELVFLEPHMHLRGKDMTFIAERPGAEREELLSIPNYHYGWQQNYRWKPDTMKFPKGTQIEVIAHFLEPAFEEVAPIDPSSFLAGAALSLLAIAIAAFQLMLDRGEQLAKFSPPQLDASFLASTLRGLMAVLVLGGLVWLVRAPLERWLEGSRSVR